MGIVFAANQKKLNRRVALKLIRTGPLASPEDLARFRAESAAAAGLSHPGVVAVYDAGNIRGFHYFSMELVEGKTLAQLLINGPLEPHRAARYAQQISDAVNHAHEHDILHRDLKPSNVIIETETDQPKITDFGLAKLLRPLEGSAAIDWTQSGAMVGTPSYMSPEQALGESKRVSQASDVYAIGAILYELLTGRAPFRAATSIETMRQVVDAEPVAPTALNTEIDRDLETICLKCLTKNPEQRYASAADLRDELNRYLNNKPINARPVSAAVKLLRWCSRNRRLTAVSSLAVASLLAGTIISATMWRLSERNASELQTSRAEMRQAIHNLHARMFSDESLYWQMTPEFRRDVLANVTNYLSTSSQDSDVNVAERKQFAEDYLAVAKIGFEFGLYDECDVATQRALSIARQLCQLNSDDRESWLLRFRAAQRRADCQQQTGSAAEVLAAIQEEEMNSINQYVALVRADESSAPSELTFAESMATASQVHQLLRGAGIATPAQQVELVDRLDQRLDAIYIETESQPANDAGMAAREIVRASKIDAERIRYTAAETNDQKLESLNKSWHLTTMLRQSHQTQAKPLVTTSVQLGLIAQERAAIHHHLSQEGLALHQAQLAEEIFSTCRRISPQNRTVQTHGALAKSMLAVLQGQHGDFEPAEQKMAEAVDAWVDQIRQNPVNTTARMQLLRCLAKHAEFAAQVDKKKEAVVSLRKLAGDSLMWVKKLPEMDWPLQARMWALQGAIQYSWDAGDDELAHDLEVWVVEYLMESDARSSWDGIWQAFYWADLQMPSQLDIPPLQEWFAELRNQSAVGS